MTLRATRRFSQSLLRAQSATPVSSNPVEGQLFQWGTFDWEDPFNLESRLTEDEKAFRDAFKRYCDEKLMTRIVMDNRNNRQYSISINFYYSSLIKILTAISCMSLEKWVPLVSPALKIMAVQVQIQLPMDYLQEK